MCFIAWSELTCVLQRGLSCVLVLQRAPATLGAACSATHVSNSEFTTSFLSMVSFKCSINIMVGHRCGTATVDAWWCRRLQGDGHVLPDVPYQQRIQRDTPHRLARHHFFYITLLPIQNSHILLKRGAMWRIVTNNAIPLQGKSQLLPPAPPYYPIPRGKTHTRGNIWSFTVG